MKLTLAALSFTILFSFSAQAGGPATVLTVSTTTNVSPVFQHKPLDGSLGASSYNLTIKFSRDSTFLVQDGTRKVSETQGGTVMLGHTIYPEDYDGYGHLPPAMEKKVVGMKSCYTLATRFNARGPSINTQRFVMKVVSSLPMEKWVLNDSVTDLIRTSILLAMRPPANTLSCEWIQDPTYL